MGTSLLWQTDAQLHDSVQRQLEWDPEIDASDIAVIASNGVITLTGFVHSYAAKLAAERSVKGVRGVRAVANDIYVSLRSERTDPEIAKDAVYALAAHSGVPNRVTVTVRHGFVTLEPNTQVTGHQSAFSAHFGQCTTRTTSNGLPGTSSGTFRCATPRRDAIASQSRL